MTKKVALLRGINVGGHRKIKMADLRLVFQALGAQELKSYLQSGNVIFSHSGLQATEIEKAIKTEWDLDVTVLLRSGQDFTKLVQLAPFAEAVAEDYRRVHVCFLDHPIEPEQLNLLEPLCTGGERLQLLDQALAIDYPQLSGRSKLTLAQIEKKLGVSGTARNWKTVLALNELLA